MPEEDALSRLKLQASSARRRELEARIEAEAAEDAMARIIATMNAALDALTHAGPPLTETEPVRHTRDNMSATPDVGTVQTRRGRPSDSTRPFVVWLAGQGSSLTAWADAHGLKYGRVKGWVSDEDPRRIPREYADLIELESTDPVTHVPAVPATLTSWPQGIS